MRDFESAKDNRLAAALQGLDPDALAPAPPASSHWRAAVVAVVVAMVVLSVGTWGVAQSHQGSRTPAVEPVTSNTPSAAAPSVVPSPTSLAPTPSAQPTPTPSAQPTPTPSTSAQVTSLPKEASTPPTSPAGPPSTLIVGGSAWNSHVLVITGHSLGGVTIGMSSAAAARAAGVAGFTNVGDGVLQPVGRPTAAPYLYLSNFAGQPPASFRGDFICVAAGDRRPRRSPSSPPSDYIWVTR